MIKKIRKKIRFYFLKRKIKKTSTDNNFIY